MKLTKFQLYKLLRNNEDLKDERHPMFEKNRFMKFLAIFMWLYYAAILLFLGTIMPLGMKHAYAGVAAYHVFDGWFPVVLIIDFWIRFVLQETPAQVAKPYALLPVRRSFLMHTYLLRSGFSLGNLYWWFMLVPFGLLAIACLLGWIPFFGWMLAWWMMCIADGFAYLFVRALCLKHLAWLLLPIAIHGGIIGLMVGWKHNLLDPACTEFLFQCTRWNPLCFVALAAIIAVLYWMNFKIQNKMVYNEVGKKEEVELKHATQMNFLNRYGQLGEYLKLEMKMRMRNKTVRMQFLVGLGLMTMFAVIMYFSDVYDNAFMKSFICMYDYIVLGMMTLIVIMCYEGNYIDGLMSRRESIYQLLRAKYYFNSVLLLVPIIILTPLMYIGKMSVWMNVGYMLFTMGGVYPLIFQLAVYNNNTIPMNAKLTGKQGNMTQQIVSLLTMALPIGLEKLATLLLGDPWGFVLLAVLGIIGIATHQIWLRNIYKRFMVRRHVNMEGFRASRN